MQGRLAPAVHIIGCMKCGTSTAWYEITRPLSRILQNLRISLRYGGELVATRTARESMGLRLDEVPLPPGYAGLPGDDTKLVWMRAAGAPPPPRALLNAATAAQEARDALQ